MISTLILNLFQIPTWCALDSLKHFLCYCFNIRPPNHYRPDYDSEDEKEADDDYVPEYKRKKVTAKPGSSGKTVTLTPAPPISLVNRAVPEQATFPDSPRPLQPATPHVHWTMLSPTSIGIAPDTMPTITPLRPSLRRTADALNGKN